ncbi:hypothetical protein [uncultured Veillonella sp.]|uniref:hypothetical protein n=1 Tax=uncultured Veillonella sp. TaxID=159268 RepID=UPI0025E8D4BA|nr:hypothetical protein [uncultured Veillonella sp.]
MEKNKINDINSIDDVEFDMSEESLKYYDNSNVMGTKQQNEIAKKREELNELEINVSKNLDALFLDLDSLVNESNSMSNPENLSDIVINEVWNQLGQQLGLEMTDETTSQAYIREHPEQAPTKEAYQQIKDKVMQNKNYQNKKKEASKLHKEGKAKDEYTGNILDPEKDTVNIDHVVSRAETHMKWGRVQGHIPTEELANIEENLAITNEALNKSKGAKSVTEYSEKSEQRAKDLLEQNKKANEKIRNSNKSEEQKKKEIEENNKRLADKLAADPELMKAADDAARAAQNKAILKAVAKETTKKALRDALIVMITTVLKDFLREIANAIYQFFKSSIKNLEMLLMALNDALIRFYENLTKSYKKIFKQGLDSIAGTFFSAIIDNMIKDAKKVVSNIKQLIGLGRQINEFWKKPENKEKEFIEKAGGVIKIITTTIVGSVGLFLHTILTKAAESIPGFQIPIPLFGTIGSLIAGVVSGIISGVIGAIALYEIDKKIKQLLKRKKEGHVLDKKNEIITEQIHHNKVLESQATLALADTYVTISNAIGKSKAFMRESLEKEVISKETIEVMRNNRKEDLVRLQDELDDLFN